MVMSSPDLETLIHFQPAVGVKPCCFANIFPRLDQHASQQRWSILDGSDVSTGPEKEIKQPANCQRGLSFKSPVVRGDLVRPPTSHLCPRLLLISVHRVLMSLSLIMSRVCPDPLQLFSMFAQLTAAPPTCAEGRQQLPDAFMRHFDLSLHHRRRRQFRNVPTVEISPSHEGLLVHSVPL